MATHTHSVRVGKKCNTIYVHTPKGAVLRYRHTYATRALAVASSRLVRSRLAGGGRLTPTSWLILTTGGAS